MMLTTEETLLMLVESIVITILIYIAYWIFHNPFHYPYFTYSFDVSHKRNVDIVDYIDRFLCDDLNWYLLNQHKHNIEQWKHNKENYLQSCMLRKIRIRQYHEVLDDKCAFRFKAFRDQTRYKQQNYVKTSYKVSVLDSEKFVNWTWLVNRHNQLGNIGFETTLKEYNSKNQRKLMTKNLRRKIMERDNYTCCICGKYMPDEVGLHIDHIVPIAKGGKSVPSNLQVLCSKCNGRKSAKL